MIRALNSLLCVLGGRSARDTILNCDVSIVRRQKWSARLPEAITVTDDKRHRAFLCAIECVEGAFGAAMQKGAD